MEHLAQVRRGVIRVGVVPAPIPQGWPEASPDAFAVAVVHFLGAPKELILSWSPYHAPLT